MVRPAIALITTVEPVHIEHFASLAAIADAKGEIFSGLQYRRRPPSSTGTARISIRLCSPTRRRPEGRPDRQRSASTRRPMSAPSESCMRPDLSVVDAVVMGEAVTYKLGTAGPAHGAEFARRHGGDPCARRRPRPGRAVARHAVPTRRWRVARGPRLRDRRRATAYLIDESYNANPAAVRAASGDAWPASRPGRAGAASRCSATCWNSALRRPEDHFIAALAEAVEAARDRSRLHGRPADAPPVRGAPGQPARRLGVADTAADLIEPLIARSCGAGDAVMIKGSNGSRMGHGLSTR